MRRGIYPAILLAVALCSPAQAASVTPIRDQTVLKECGGCHMAFPAGLLPARSWDKMLTTTNDHFGEDLALSPDLAGKIRAVLMAGAGDTAGGRLSQRYMRWVNPQGAPQRITENPDFDREHRFPPAVWKRADVVTRSNCLACHPAANNGIFDDD